MSAQIGKSRILLLTVLLAFAARDAHATERKCVHGQVWSISAGTCVKQKPARKQSPQDRYDRAVEDLDGRGKAPDPRRGLALLETTCTAGHGASCTLLGFLSSRGRGVSKDDKRAMTYFEQGCKLDDLEGCVYVGELASRTGEYPSSRIAYQRACELGSGVACARAGVQFENGIGGEKLPTAATPLFEKALELLKPRCPGDGSACYVVGWLHENGKGTPKNLPTAIDAYRAGCATGSGDSCMNLATALDHGAGGKVDPDGANAAYDKACRDYDNAGACQQIAERLGKAKFDLPRALGLARRGCDLDPKECGTLAEFYRLGYGMPAPDQVAATRFYKQSCDSGALGWCERYGERAWVGTGMSMDRDLAVVILERACKGRYIASCLLAAQHLVELGKDDLRAATLSSIGCEYKHGEACWYAGLLASQGKGGMASHERALGFYDKSCGFKSAAGCTAAGDAYRSGTGTAKEPTKALERYEDGCLPADRPSAAACASWGRMQYFGEGADKTVIGSLTAFARACELGDAESCTFIVGLLAETKDGKRDVVMSALERGCTADHEAACLARAQLLVASKREPDRRAGYALFAAACTRKSDEGCLAQANLLADGWGVTADPAKAEQLFRTRCDGGNAAACYGMGRLHDRAARHEEALKLYRRACDGSYADACSQVGFAYYTALHVRWDITAAASYFIRSCELGSAVGCANSADVYRYGVGAKLDHAKAFAHYDKACQPASASGCAGLGHYLATGEGGVKVDRKRAEEALRASCNDTEPAPEGCRELADLIAHDRGKPGEIARLRTTAFARAQELAKDNPYYMYLVGTYHAEGMATAKDPPAARGWFAKACDGFDPLGCIAAGTLFAGSTVPADRDRARVFLERACAAGMAEGCGQRGKAAGPTPVRHGQGCCGGEIAPGAELGLALVIAAMVRRRRTRYRVRHASARDLRASLWLGPVRGRLPASRPR
ncbi:MAG: tetratricopeptide repeat protein [Kofleriaceae bacterium]